MIAQCIVLRCIVENKLTYMSAHCYVLRGYLRLRVAVKLTQTQRGNDQLWPKLFRAFPVIFTSFS